jgi:phosphoribosylanthranilate isomerase
MPSNTRVKICGLRDQVAVDGAVAAGANYVGFVFFPKSPRNVTTAQAAALAPIVPVGVAKVGLFVNPDNAQLDETLADVPLDFIQLHGNETPDRVAEVRTRYGLPVMKALGIADANDLPAIDIYAQVADQLLIDTKAPKNTDRPGGNGEAFDWTLIAKRRWAVPWMLAGGLTKDNVAQAIAATGAQQIDLSSGVETSPGVKSAKLMTEFIAAARA